MNHYEWLLDLTKFDGAGGGAAGGAEGGGDGAGGPGSEGAAQPTETKKTLARSNRRSGNNPLSDVRYGKQEMSDDGSKQDQPETFVTTKESSAQEDKAALFEQLIKGEYKNEFTNRMQGIIDKRFAEAKRTEEALDSIVPILDVLASRYGVENTDVEAMLKAIEDDDAYFKDEALEKGITVEQLKEIKRMERENKALKAAQRQAENERKANEDMLRWGQEADALKQIYPEFDLGTECSDPETGNDFIKLLNNGISVKVAYEVIHRDDLIGGAMARTAQAVQQKVANSVQANMHRPSENGTSNNASVITKTDVHKLTKADRKEIARRVERGERIIF